MSQVQYRSVVIWDSTLIDVGFMSSDVSVVVSALSGLAINASKITTGAPNANAGHFTPGALIQNLVDGTLYINSGSTASPIWSLLDTGNPFSLPDAVTDSTTTTGTSFALIMSALTTGVGQKITASAATTAIINEVIASAANLTGAGRYYAANDGALNVFSIGPNGHIHSLQTTAPTVAVTTANGITAAAVTAGSTDTAGNVTTTGTSTGGSVVTVTFNKTYTTAPKVVILEETNAAAVTGGVYVSAVTATTVAFTIPSASGATPSWSYLVVA